MKLRRRSAVLLVVTLSLASLLAAEEAEQPQVVTTDLGGGLYLLAGIGGNIAVQVGEHDLQLVDSGYPGLTEPLHAALAKISTLPVRLLVNTHWHFDHIGSNQAMAATGATLLAHSSVRDHMSAPQHLAILERDVEPAPPLARPAVTYAGDLTLHRGDETVDLLHLANAHTDGDTVVRFRQADVIHTGDVVFYCGYPFIDVSHGGTIDGMIAAVEKILAMCSPQTRIIPGHGPLTNAAGLATYLEMLRSYREAVAREVAAGKDLEAIRSGGATAELDQRWGEVFFPPARFAEAVYRSLPR